MYYSHRFAYYDKFSVARDDAIYNSSRTNPPPSLTCLTSF